MSHVDCIPEVAIEKGGFEVNLPERLILVGGESKDNSRGSRVDYRSIGLVIKFELGRIDYIASDHPSSLIG